MGIISNIEKTYYIEAPRKFLPKQIDTLNSCLTDEAILYSGAFRAGKTLLLVHAAIRACLENPGTEGLLASQTSTTLKSVVMDLLEHELYLYQDAITAAGIDLKLAIKIKHTQGDMEVVFYNGSRVRFRACDEERKLAGYTLDFFGIDEPVDVAEHIFTQLIGRISGTGNLKNKFGLLTTNPGSELHWLYKYFYLMKLDRYIHIDTTTYDNVLLPDYDNYIKSKEQVWDKDWIRRYLNGQWGMFEGQIYKDFNPNTMVGDFKKTPVSYHIAGIDWGLENPHCILDIGVTEDRRLIVLREHYGKKMTTSELAPLIAEWHKDVRFRKLYCDPSAADLIKQVYDKGVPIAQSKNGKITGYANNDVNNGIAKVKSLFRNKLILIDESCVNLIQELQAYRYKDNTEKPIPENDHACDAIRYGVTDFNPDMDVIGFKSTFTNLFKRRY